MKTQIDKVPIIFDNKKIFRTLHLITNYSCYRNIERFIYLSFFDYRYFKIKITIYYYQSFLYSQSDMYEKICMII